MKTTYQKPAPMKRGPIYLAWDVRRKVRILARVEGEYSAAIGAYVKAVAALAKATT